MSSLLRVLLCCAALASVAACAAGVVPVPVPAGTVTVPADDGNDGGY